MTTAINSATPLRRRGGDKNNISGTLFTHNRDNCLRHGESPTHIDLHDFVKLVHADIHQLSAISDPRVIDEDVDCPEG